MNHSKTPWLVEEEMTVESKLFKIRSSDISPAHEVARTNPYLEAKGIKDAQHIVNCVNNHDMLVQALKEIQQETELPKTYLIGNDRAYSIAKNTLQALVEDTHAKEED